MKKLLTKFSVCLTAFALVSGITTATEPDNNNKSNNNEPAAAAPHCEVPCGIYADQRRFEEMLEDTATIAKSIASITEMSEGFQEGPPSATAINQLTRWVSTKENHATNTQHIVAQYFLTQRIKADNERYEEQLKAAHNVMVAAMKCKQDAAPATADNLKLAIGQLYRAYEGKDPEFEKDHG